MKTQITRFSILRTSFIMTLVSVITFAFLLIPLFLWSFFMGDMGPVMGPLAAAMGPLSLLLVLVMVFVMNFLGLAGLLWTYNLIARVWGGIEWESKEVQSN